MSNYEPLAEVLKDTVNNKIADITSGLFALVGIVTESVTLDRTSTGSAIACNLSDEELYALVIRIPAECVYVQSEANKLSVEHSLDSILTDCDISDNTQHLQGSKGDARERQKRAEAMACKQILHDTATRQIAKALNDAIERADKVYEGLKKIIDARSREFVLNAKPGRPYGQ